MVVGALVKTAREQVLASVVLALLGVRQVAIACVEALGQKQEPTDAVPELLELAWVGELVRMALGMVGPDVLNLIAFPSALRVLGAARCLAGASLQVVRHAREQARDFATIHAVPPRAVMP